MKNKVILFCAVSLTTILYNCRNDNCQEYTVMAVDLDKDDTLGFPYSLIDTVGYYIQSKYLTDSVSFIRTDRVQDYGPVRRIATEADPVCYDQKDEFLTYEFSNSRHELNLVFKSYMGNHSFKINNLTREYSFNDDGIKNVNDSSTFQFKDSLVTHAYRVYVINSVNVELLNHPTLGVLSIADSSLETYINRYK